MTGENLINYINRKFYNSHLMRTQPLLLLEMGNNVVC